MPNNEPNPRDTPRILDQLVKKGILSEQAFKDKHHLGDSIAGFRRYCSKITSFKPNGNNHRLHEWLQKLLDSRS
jgi:hypothetical protein